VLKKIALIFYIQHMLIILKHIRDYIVKILNKTILLQLVISTSFLHASSSVPDHCSPSEKIPGPGGPAPLLTSPAESDSKKASANDIHTIAKIPGPGPAPLLTPAAESDLKKASSHDVHTIDVPLEEVAVIPADSKFKGNNQFTLHDFVDSSQRVREQYVYGLTVLGHFEKNTLSLISEYLMPSPFAIYSYSVGSIRTQHENNIVSLGEIMVHAVGVQQGNRLHNLFEIDSKVGNEFSLIHDSLKSRSSTR
jgi:hypothetical protein